MKKQDKTTDPQRRNFLRGTVAAGAGVAITAAAAEMVVGDTAQPNADGPAKKAGYRLSQHILDYYKTCVR